MEANELQWYVVRAVSGQEKKVKANLESELIKAKLTDYAPASDGKEKGICKLMTERQGLRELGKHASDDVFGPRWWRTAGIAI